MPEPAKRLDAAYRGDDPGGRYESWITLFAVAGTLSAVASMAYWEPPLYVNLFYSERLADWDYPANEEACSDA